jgi:hypothetical protein
MPELPAGSAEQSLTDDATRQEYWKALRAYYRYRAEGYTHRQGLFAWQMVESRIIFVVVILLVLSGVYFSGVQFHHSLARENRPHRTRNKGEEEVAREVEQHVPELTASAKEIKISSPVLGVIILMISFIFFYLYLLYVYPIQDVF